MYGAWCEGLVERGFSVVSAVDLLALPYPPPPYPRGITQTQIARKNFNLTASRLPIAALPGWDSEQIGERLFDDHDVFRVKR